MTPTQKAIKIYDRFIQINGNSFFAKECGYFLIEEIISTGSLNDEEIYVNSPYYLGYWEEVKRELKRL